ncbi:MAG: GNAT family N-acetyltransferase [Vulcanimicrobiota bacterium]
MKSTMGISINPLAGEIFIRCLLHNISRRRTIKGLVRAEEREIRELKGFLDGRPHHSHLWLIPFLEHYHTFDDQEKAEWEVYCRRQEDALTLAVTVNLGDRFAVISGESAGLIPELWQLCREKQVTRVFAEPSFLAGLAERFGSSFTAATRARKKYIYRLKPGELRVSPDRSFRKARESDYELLVQWYGAFVKEEKIAVNEDYLRILKAGLLYVYLKDTRVASMVRVPVIGTSYAKISAVYTPPEERRKGCATQLQANVSAIFLGSGLSMITDPEDSNIASITCYEKLGFSRIGKEISLYPEWRKNPEWGKNPEVESLG